VKLDENAYVFVALAAAVAAGALGGVLWVALGMAP
jgi:hypothetical protein